MRTFEPQRQPRRPARIFGGWRIWKRADLASSVPVRILVQGGPRAARVTRLVTAGLSGGGMHVVGKTSSALPRLLFVDGREFPVYRPGQLTHREQSRSLVTAADERADALVIESLAAGDALPTERELRTLQPTHAVWTDATPPTAPSFQRWQATISRHLPAHGLRFVCADDAPSHHATTCSPDGARSSHPGQLLTTLTIAELNRFTYIEESPVVELALRVCAEFGVARSTALAAMVGAAPDPGVMTVYRQHDAGQTLTFLDGFAASFEPQVGQAWRTACERFSHERSTVIINCRPDRAHLFPAWAQQLAQWSPADSYLVVGSDTHHFARCAAQNGIDPDRLLCAEQMPASRLIQLVRLRAAQSLVLGIGSLSHAAVDLVDLLRHQERRASAMYSARTGWRGGRTAARTARVTAAG